MTSTGEEGEHDLHLQTHGAHFDRLGAPVGHGSKFRMNLKMPAMHESIKEPKASGVQGGTRPHARPKAGSKQKECAHQTGREQIRKAAAAGASPKVAKCLVA